jgi:hypothetical protein
MFFSPFIKSFNLFHFFFLINFLFFLWTVRVKE